MGKYVWPCPEFSRISSGYGNRIGPFYGKEFHDGVDLAAPSGRPILAAADGTVTVSGKNGGYGNYIRIEHSGGIISFYGHCKALYVSKGDKVSAGQRIASVGTTGASTGNHLHFGMHKNGKSVNPLSYVSENDTAANYNRGKNDTANTAAEPLPSVKNEAKEITSVAVKSTTGIGTAQKLIFPSLPACLKHGLEIIIQNDKAYLPCIEGGVKLERPRSGSPSKLTFTVVKDGIINFQEGNPVSMRFNGNAVFYGYVFTKSRSDSRLIDVTAYDQIRYLKNKESLSYQDKTYSELLKMVADDYYLNIGDVEDTKFKIERRIEESALIDILQTASDLTLLNTGRLYVLYDDFGKLSLKDIQSMKLDVVIDEDTAQGYDYTSSIDNDVYTKVKLTTDNSETGEREAYVFNDTYNQGFWGQL